MTRQTYFEIVLSYQKKRELLTLNQYDEETLDVKWNILFYNIEVQLYLPQIENNQSFDSSNSYGI